MPLPQHQSGENCSLQFHWWHGWTWQIKPELMGKKQTPRDSLCKILVVVLSWTFQDLWKRFLCCEDVLSNQAPPHASLWYLNQNIQSRRLSQRMTGRKSWKFTVWPLLFCQAISQIYMTRRQREGVYGKNFHSWALLEKTDIFINEHFSP